METNIPDTAMSEAQKRAALRSAVETEMKATGCSYGEAFSRVALLHPAWALAGPEPGASGIHLPLDGNASSTGAVGATRPHADYMGRAGLPQPSQTGLPQPPNAPPHKLAALARGQEGAHPVDPQVMAGIRRKIREGF
ncbi:MAG: hypothetical protein ABSH34_12090 [Verrucomicrobiota bacterium]|jgi:hypothetical protein